MSKRNGRTVRVLVDGYCRRRFASVEQAVAFIADDTGIHVDAVWEQTRKGALVDGVGREWSVEVPVDYDWEKQSGHDEHRKYIVPRQRRKS